MNSALGSRRRQAPASLSTKNHERFYPAKTVVQRRRMSEATEFYDTEFEDSDEESLRSSLQLLEYDSNTSISSPGLPTPDAVPRKLPILQSNKGYVEGPSGPHLFRSSSGSSIYAPSTAEIIDVHLDTGTQSGFSRGIDTSNQFPLSPDPPKANLPFSPKTPKAFPIVCPDVSQLHEDEIRGWMPNEVSKWLRMAAYPDRVVNIFMENDISGNVLLDLNNDLLKHDLGFKSFGTRHQLMSSINHLKETMQKGSLIPEALPSLSSGGRSSPELSSESSGDNAPQHVQEPLFQGRSSPERRSYAMTVSPSGEVLSSHLYGQVGNQITPAESVSIVAIEEYPRKSRKPHNCTPEECRAYERHQRREEKRRKQLAAEFPGATFHNGVLFLGNPGNPDSARNLLRPTSETQPSVVASSDVFGPQTGPWLSEAALGELQRVDPQETVRNFLRNQHVDEYPQHVDLTVDTKDVPRDNFARVSPPDAQPNTMAANLRNLPKLTIPTSPNTEDMTTAVTTNRYFTPTHQNGSPTAVQQFGPFSQAHNTQGIQSYRQGTPFSEMDVPITAIPNDPVPRDVSQSVPPSMQYGTLFPAYHSIARSASTRPQMQPLRRVNEDKPLTPIDGPADLIKSPRQRQNGFNSSKSSLASDPDVTHAGYMKKRKTTRLIRHEWQDAHFTLRGTNMAMHKDEREAHRISRAIDSFDVDDYSVACSSLATSSKISAAIKRSILRNGNTTADTRDGTAFSFSLIPATKENEKKALFGINGVKSHHFAVKTREQRIDWMRELMLAKALKKGRESGDDILVNGNVI